MGAPSRLIEHDALEAGALAILHRAGALSEPVCFEQLRGVHADTVSLLEASGVLKMVPDDFGALTVQLDSARVRFDALSLIGSSIQAFRCTAPGPPLLLPKIYHMMRLCEEGWATLPDDGPSSFRMGEQLQCQLI